MKKTLALILCLVMMFSLISCGGYFCQHRDTDDDNLCDKCSESYSDGQDVFCEHRDANDDLICDECRQLYDDGKDVFCEHRDANDDYLCDKCFVYFYGFH